MLPLEARLGQWVAGSPAMTLRRQGAAASAASSGVRLPSPTRMVTRTMLRRAILHKPLTGSSSLCYRSVYVRSQASAVLLPGSGHTAKLACSRLMRPALQATAERRQGLPVVMTPLQLRSVQRMRRGPQQTASL